MSSAKFFIQHKVATLLAVILIVIFGVMFGTQLQKALMPDIEAPMAVVVCYYNGASPSDMEELVTRPLEGAIMSVPGVDSVQSTSADSTSQIMITYVEGTDLDIAATKLREKFNAVSLPEDAIDPVIMNMNISELMPTAIIALMGEDLGELQALAGELETLEKVYAVLESGQCARTLELTEDERACLADTPLLTLKPVIYVANVSEQYAAVEPELADEEKAVEDFQRRLLCRSEHGDGDGQIKGRAFFFDRGRRQIDDNAPWRNIKALVFHRRADTFLALFDRGVRQTDDLPGRHAAAGIDLNLDGVGSKTAQGGGVDLCEHGSFLL